MNKIAFLILAVALSGCVSCSPRILLTPQQVIDSKEPEEAELIAVLEQQLHKARHALILLMQSDQIDAKSTNEIMAQTRVVDYYICAAWTAMVEGDTKQRDKATQLAEAGSDVLMKQLTDVIKKIERTGI